MKRILAVRMYDFCYFHSLFFEHYFNLKFDIILVYCKNEHISIIKDTSKVLPVLFLELPDHNIPYNYNEEKSICNYIYQNTLNYYEKNYLQDEALILFADDDEFYSEIDATTIISKVVFSEWYLDAVHDENICANDFYNLVKNGKCKGQLLSIWNDPYYKEALIRVSIKNISFFKECVYSNGFHRITWNNNLIDTKKESLYADHLKGIPFKLAKERILKCFQAIKIEDDWCSNHYTIEFKKYFINYDIFYEKLMYKDALEDYISERLQSFIFEASFYERNVLPLDWTDILSNVPSVHFKKKLI